jgi:hypothetical protein
MLLFGVVRYSTNHPAAIYSFLLQMWVSSLFLKAIQ